MLEPKRTKHKSIDIYKPKNRPSLKHMVKNENEKLEFKPVKIFLKQNKNVNLVNINNINIKNANKSKPKFRLPTADSKISKKKIYLLTNSTKGKEQDNKNEQKKILLKISNIKHGLEDKDNLPVINNVNISKSSVIRFNTNANQKDYYSISKKIKKKNLKLTYYPSEVSPARAELNPMFNKYNYANRHLKFNKNINEIRINRFITEKNLDNNGVLAPKRRPNSRFYLKTNNNFMGEKSNTQDNKNKSNNKGNNKGNNKSNSKSNNNTINKTNNNPNSPNNNYNSVNNTPNSPNNTQNTPNISNPIRKEPIFIKNAKKHPKLNSSNRYMPNKIADYFAKSDQNSDFNKTMDDFVDYNLHLVEENNETLSFFAIYDGHNGPNVSNFLKENLQKTLVKNIKQQKKSITDQSSLSQVVHETFRELDAVLLRNPQNKATGSTATVILINNSSLLCANVGDSKCFYVTKNDANELTAEHNCKNQTEIERIKKRNGKVFLGRVFGSLMITRAFGDNEYKEYGVSAEPSISLLDIDKNSVKFVVLASDGIWDVISKDELYQLSKAGNSQKVCETLVSNSMQRATRDNVSCIVVGFE